MRTMSAYPPYDRGPQQAAKNVSVQYGPGLMGCTFLVFLTLKLCGVIDWHWGWVTAPLWGPPALVVAVVLMIAIVASLVMLGMFCFKIVRDLWRGER